MPDIASYTTPAALYAALADDEDVLRIAASDWIQYRTSPALQALTTSAHSICARINEVYFSDPDLAARLFRELVPGAAKGVDFRPPLSIDYGMQLVIGANSFINADFMIIGGGKVTIGEDCLIGPRCGIYTPNHAEDPVRRQAGWERPLPVTIGDNVWLGGSVTITPGVTIGSDSIIGAGSVVTRDIEPGVVAVGNPCCPVRPLRLDSGR